MHQRHVAAGLHQHCLAAPERLACSEACKRVRVMSLAAQGTSGGSMAQHGRKAAPKACGLAAPTETNPDIECSFPANPHLRPASAAPPCAQCCLARPPASLAPLQPAYGRSSLPWVQQRVTRPLQQRAQPRPPPLWAGSSRAVPAQPAAPRWLARLPPLPLQPPAAPAAPAALHPGLPAAAPPGPAGPPQAQL